VSRAAKGTEENADIENSVQGSCWLNSAADLSYTMLFANTIF